MKKSLLALLSLVVILGGCGGGGGGGGGGVGDGGGAPSDIGGTTFSGAGGRGELLTYTFDKEKLKYAYKITDSAFGLGGNTGSGTLTKNEDGTYTPSGHPEARVISLSESFIVGAVPGPGDSDMLFAGVPKLSKNFVASEIAGLYNWVEYRCNGSMKNGTTCSADDYRSDYGTFIINSNKTWKLCVQGDLGGLVGNCSFPFTGKWSDTGNGTIKVTDDTGQFLAGTAMILPSSNEGKVLVVDLKDDPTNDDGPGILIGVKQVDISNLDVGGAYQFYGSEGDFGQVVVNNAGNSFSVTQTNPTVNGNGTFSRNQPWKGMLKTGDGTLALMLPGEGVWANFDPSDNTWFDVGGKVTTTSTGGDTGGQQSLSIAGRWKITEAVVTTSCTSNPDTTPFSYDVTIVQNGANITVTASFGSWEGTITGDIVSWAGTTNNVDRLEMSLTLSADGNRLDGTLTTAVTLSNPIRFCNGTNSMSGTKL